MNKETLTLPGYRELLYRFFASVFLEEIDSRMLEELLQMRFPQAEGNAAWQQDLDAGFRMIENYLHTFDGKSDTEKKESLEYLAADYAKTFLAAGDATGKAAFPYESIYVGTDSTFGGSIQMNLNAIYAAKGLTMREDMFRVMEDHVGLELNYMAELLAEEVRVSPDPSAAEKLQTEQKEFFRTHLINWILLFTQDVYKYAELDFYKGIARAVTGFMEAEQEFFAE